MIDWFSLQSNIEILQTSQFLCKKKSLRTLIGWDIYITEWIINMALSMTNSFIFTFGPPSILNILLRLSFFLK